MIEVWLILEILKCSDLKVNEYLVLHNVTMVDMVGSIHWLDILNLCPLQLNCYFDCNSSSSANLAICRLCEVVNFFFLLTEVKHVIVLLFNEWQEC